MNQESPLQRLPDDILEKVVAALPSEVKEVLYVFPQLFVAGGAIRAILAGEPVKDIDIFTTSLDAVSHAVPRYIQEFSPWGDWKETQTPCTRTVTVKDIPPVQFVNNVAYVSPEDCVRQFDFTVCQAAIWKTESGWDSCCSPSFIRDVADKRLVYTTPNRVEAPGGSLWRAIKYAQRGYSITQMELAKLIERLVEGQRKIKVEHFKANDMVVDDKECHGITASEIQRSFSMRGRFGGIY